MGRTKGSYNSEFPKGSMVRVRAKPFLEQFQKNWCYHHPLETEQLAYAGREAEVTEVAAYHGADELYTLAGVPGNWNEQCLEPVSG